VCIKPTAGLFPSSSVNVIGPFGKPCAPRAGTYEASLDSGINQGQLIGGYGRNQACSHFGFAPPHLGECATDLKADRHKLQTILAIIELAIVYAYRKGRSVRFGFRFLFCHDFQLPYNL
jgi:hypothetical protein